MKYNKSYIMHVSAHSRADTWHCFDYQKTALDSTINFINGTLQRSYNQNIDVLYITKL